MYTAFPSELSAAGAAPLHHSYTAPHITWHRASAKAFYNQVLAHMSMKMSAAEGVIRVHGHDPGSDIDVVFKTKRSNRKTPHSLTAAAPIDAARTSASTAGVDDDDSTHQHVMMAGDHRESLHHHGDSHDRVGDAHHHHHYHRNHGSDFDSAVDIHEQQQQQHQTHLDGQQELMECRVVSSMMQVRLWVLP